jgi:transcription-repair coupling factor (superfamily II helicase)
MSHPPVTSLSRAVEALKAGYSLTLAQVVEGFDALVLADLARGLSSTAKGAATIGFVARNSQRMEAMRQALEFTAPDMEILVFPAFDCQPYDRVSPHADLIAQRMTVLARLARSQATSERARIVLMPVTALTQRVPPIARMKTESFSCAPGHALKRDDIVSWLELSGYLRAATVRDIGDYAVRGGILDLFPPGFAAPVRLDFFGDTVETLRHFDVETQRSTTALKSLDLVPMSEAPLTSETIRRFRQGYIAAFGAARKGDTLYEGVSEGRRPPGLEHWLPLLHDRLDTLFDYLANVPLLLDARADDAARERFAQIADYYEARCSTQPQPGLPPYHPLPPDSLYLAPKEWEEHLGTTTLARLTPEVLPEQSIGKIVVNALSHVGRNFTPERAQENQREGENLFEAVAAYVKLLQHAGKRVLVAAWSAGTRERLTHVLEDHGVTPLHCVGRFDQVFALPEQQAGIGQFAIEHGFELETLAVLAEQDILGDRLVRTKRKSRNLRDVLKEAASLAPHDLVVHADHGIGRFVGLKTIEAAGVPRDCLELHYAGGDRIFLPVENIELLTRYGSEGSDAALDRLGGAGWQVRKAKLKSRLREMAGSLIKIAAARMLREAPKSAVPDGLYEEFCARFPYEETEDQRTAIEAVQDDLSSGRPMDRLICGDVGFGKTEIALRAAFLVAMSGKQVAIVTPTTLLARQHYKSFCERFRGLPLTLAQASRFVPAGELKAVKQGLSEGKVDIVIGTHALLSKSISFKDLGLVVIDEEQHFGVAHKERLKDIRAEAHVLTLSATPIPRTLQLAMTGVRELSILATPPVDRLAVRSFVMPFDPLPIREALLRERYRGGQAFYVVPRIEDLNEISEFLSREVPEARVGIGHGQMAASQLEEVMTAFYEGKYDILLSTTIVESGLDIPSANTLIVHRADMFGLAQLYQLRGRVGRSKIRAYALFTIPADAEVTAQAQKRLEVLQSLDTLGAGFQLASHDLDIRGAGNLLGEEQSGHIREVGYELYQQMLEDAVSALKAGVDDLPDETWSPTITIGTPVKIPESYIEDLTLRMQIYRRLAGLENEAEIVAFGAELTDRFGTPPDVVQQLLRLMQIKVLCRLANIAKVEAGTKGVVLAFRDGAFANPSALMAWIGEQGSFAKVRPDMSLVLTRDWPKPQDQLKGVTFVVKALAKMAG